MSQLGIQEKQEKALQSAEAEGRIEQGCSDNGCPLVDETADSIFQSSFSKG